MDIKGKSGMIGSDNVVSPNLVAQCESTTHLQCYSTTHFDKHIGKKNVDSRFLVW